MSFGQKDSHFYLFFIEEIFFQMKTFRNANFYLNGFSILISNRLFLLKTNEYAKLMVEVFFGKLMLKISSDKLLELLKKLLTFQQNF